MRLVVKKKIGHPRIVGLDLKQSKGHFLPAADYQGRAALGRLAERFLRRSRPRSAVRVRLRRIPELGGKGLYPLPQQRFRPRFQRAALGRQRDRGPAGERFGILRRGINIGCVI